jgi:hypothetical protein
MNRYISCSIVAIALIGRLALGAAHTEVRGNTEKATLTIHAELQKSSVQCGDTIVITVKITNVSTRAVTFVDTYGEFDYSFEIKNARKRPVPMRPEWKQASDTRTVLRAKEVTLRPGEHLETVMSSVERMYNLESPDSYRITVSRDFGKETGIVRTEAIVLRVRACPPTAPAGAQQK